MQSCEHGNRRLIGRRIDQLNWDIQSQLARSIISRDVRPPIPSRAAYSGVPQGRSCRPPVQSYLAKPAAVHFARESDGTVRACRLSQRTPEATELSDNKFSGRGDANTNFGLLTAYYYWDKYNQISPYWPGNAPLYPGFSVDGKGQTYNITLGDTKTFSSVVGERISSRVFPVGYLVQPAARRKGSEAPDLGFASGASGAPGILPLVPSLEGVPEIDFNNFVIGVPSRPNGLIENIYQIVDNYSKIIGTHTIKFGGQYHYNQLEEDLIDNVSNGNFFFGSNFNGQPQRNRKSTSWISCWARPVNSSRASHILPTAATIIWACTARIAGA